MRDLTLRLRYPAIGTESPRQLKRDLEAILASVLPKKQFEGQVVVVPGVTSADPAFLEIRLASQELGLPPSVVTARLRHIAGRVQSKCIKKGWLEVPPETVAPAHKEESLAADLQVDPCIFAEIYDRDAHVRIITEAIQLAMRTKFKKRCHVLLYGSPACAKTEILKAFARVLAPHGVLSMDATATTKAGVEKLLIDGSAAPKFLLVEELEKKEEEALRWMLGVLDQRGEINKVNFNIGAVCKCVPALCIATVNDIDLFNDMLHGALTSRFAHKLYCGRPDRALLERILAREVQTIEGDPRWIAPALDYCLDIERTDDPRRAIAVCLTGRERLLTGEFQRDLQACQPDGREQLAEPTASPALISPAKAFTPLKPDVIHHGDALSVLRTIPSDSTHCCITSPPYWLMRDYEVGGQFGMEPTLAAYLDHLVEVFREVRRVLREDGTCWIVVGDCYGQGKIITSSDILDGHRRGNNRSVDRGLPAGNLVGVPAALAFALRGDGWCLRQDIVWAKPEVQTRASGRPETAHEHIFLLTRIPSGYHWNPKYREAQRSVWDIARSRDPNHCAAFPGELVRRCILAGCPEGGVVLDPFVGGGTTAVIARELGRKYLGIDLKPEHVALARARLGQESLRQSLEGGRK